MCVRIRIALREGSARALATVRLVSGSLDHGALEALAGLLVALDGHPVGHVYKSRHCRVSVLFVASQPPTRRRAEGTDRRPVQAGTSRPATLSRS